jgi:glycosyltransferase involved in cell wall biosynthesis
MFRRARGRRGFSILTSSDIFGDSTPRKLFFTIAERKRFLRRNLDAFSEVNHFLQVEMFYKMNPGKHIVTFHNPPPFSRHNNLAQIRNDVLSLTTSLLFYRRYYSAIQQADFIVANSEFTREGLLESGLDKDKVIVSFGGVNDNFRITKRLSERDNVIGYIGSFAFHKRLDRVLKEKRKCNSPLRGYELKLYGTKGVQLKSLKKQYDNRNRVRFCNKLPESKMVDTMNSFKAFIMPSRWETFGLPIIEAVACGTPVFVYNDSEITPEVKRFATEIGHISDIPMELEKINDEKMAEASLKAREAFSWDMHFQTMLGVYRRL